MKVAKVFISECIDEYAEYNLINDLERQKPYNAIDVYINSYGGYVTSGKGLYLILEKEKMEGIEVNTFGDTMVYSAATFPFMAGTKRTLFVGCGFLAHNPYGAFGGDANALIKYAKELKDIQDFIIELYSKKTNKPKEVFESLMQKDTIITAREAFDFGFATHILEISNCKKVNIKPFNKFFNMHKKVLDLSLLQKTSVNLGLVSKGKCYVSNAKKLNIKNMLVATDEGVSLYIYTDDSTLIDKVVVLADEAGNATEEPAPNGTHKITFDSKEFSIEVQDGVIVSASETAEDAQKPADAPATADSTNEMKEVKEALDLITNELKNVKDALAKVTDFQSKIENAKPTQTASKNVKDESVLELPEYLKNKF